MSLEQQSAPPSTAENGPASPTAPAATMHDPNRTTPFERWAVRASDSQFNALAGAVGGFTSGIVTCPLDVIKTKLQAQGGLAQLQSGLHVGQPRIYNGLVGTASVIWRDEGLRGMYRGLGPIILGYLPTWAVWFTVYNKSKTWLGQYHHNTFVINFWSSIIAGASSTIVTNPIWVIKTRLMSQTGHHDRHGFSLFPKGANTPTSRPTMSMHGYYHSTLDAARKMYTTEGIRAFYSGLTPALLGLTHVAVQFPAYEFLKTKFTGQGMGASPTNNDPKAQWFGILCASIFSKIAASSATYPHEVIRTRLQTQRRPMPGSDYPGVANVGGIPGTKAGGLSPKATEKAQEQSSAKYRGIVRTFQTILREEGWRAFYAGMGTNMMRAVPAATVTMLTYEFMMRELNQTRLQGQEKMRAREDSSFA
ncbi:mitochondrial carrier [Cryphonectria parasitica EP155]|uniref:Mitochondrial carrier n=1 Tax=Cryphonectria parasitica (strain ATCC 38755 / EP155) TaxID=660469 RepID=A0A9P4XTL8_CRYP1|nr:mitochondrial carrier [Cryphonectria parasitica EP155]KAF3760666.1 mitochondrial carrier [Cryphonectria parasitica EP155]